MKYIIPDPYCDGGVTITHITEGIWSMHPASENCKTCALFMSRISPVMDTLDDKEITNFLIAMEGSKSE
jgi:hypothetical protein